MKKWIHCFLGVLSFFCAMASAQQDPAFLPPPIPIVEPARSEALPPPSWLGSDAIQRRSVDESSSEGAFEGKRIDPDPNGVVWVGFGRAEDPPVVQNPFDIRIAPERATVETLVRFSGIVSGPVCVAIVNGRALVSGDRWAGFNVARIFRNTLLLEKNGAYVSVPRGREITIRETY